MHAVRVCLDLCVCAYLFGVCVLAGPHHNTTFVCVCVCVCECVCVCVSVCVRVCDGHRNQCKLTRSRHPLRHALLTLLTPSGTRHARSMLNEGCREQGLDTHVHRVDTSDKPLGFAVAVVRRKRCSATWLTHVPWPEICSWGFGPENPSASSVKARRIGGLSSRQVTSPCIWAT